MYFKEYLCRFWRNWHHFCFLVVNHLNSPPPSATHMHQWTVSALVQVMACRLYGAKPLPEPILDYCQLDPWEQISVKFESEFYHFHSRKCISNFRLPKWQPFCPGGDESINTKMVKAEYLLGLCTRKAWICNYKPISFCGITYSCPRYLILVPKSSCIRKH